MKKAKTKASAVRDDDAVELEEDEEIASLPSYEILTYPADFTLEVLVDKLDKDDIVVPRFQRGFVWSLSQASRLIESFLLGLPVPPVFLYAAANERSQIVVDGQQRLRTIEYFFRGRFGSKEDEKAPAFQLTGLHKKSPFFNKTYDELESDNPTAFRRLNDAVLRSFVVKQLNPQDDTSIVHIFERLNTGGTLLQGQEIRNCVYGGPFNDLLHRLNEFPKWRELFGGRQAEKRQRDIELILRFFAMLNNLGKYEKPMKEFLNKYMAKNRKMPSSKAREIQELFEDVVKRVHASLGPKPFHIRSGLNAAVFDSVFLAYGKHPKVTPTAKNIQKFKKLLVGKSKYLDNVSSATTDTEVINTRIALADAALFGGAK